MSLAKIMLMIVLVIISNLAARYICELKNRRRARTMMRCDIIQLVVMGSGFLVSAIFQNATLACICAGWIVGTLQEMERRINP